MMKASNLLKMLIVGKTSKKFIAGVLLSFSFSIGVILSTLGIMDGFDLTFRSGLKHANGDLILSGQFGFFEYGEDLAEILNAHNVETISPTLVTEGFLIHSNTSRGVVIRGVESESFSELTGLNFNLKNNEVALGLELVNQLGLKKGGEVVLALANGNQNFSTLPLLERYKIIQVVDHKVYEKNARSVYVAKQTLEKGMVVRAGRNTNEVLFNLIKLPNESVYQKVSRIEDTKKKIELDLGPSYSIKTYWREYDHLIKAVEVEKFTITLILQIIVIVSIFNVISFIVYLNEKKARELFLLQAMGTSKKHLNQVWMLLVVFLWVGSCIGGAAFAQLFDLALRNMSLFQVPGEVYNLTSLRLEIGPTQYALVFLLALLWVLIISLLGLRRIKNKPILDGLREEFN